MANSFRCVPEKVQHTAGADIASGAVVVLVSGTSGYCGIAEAAIANGATGAVQVEGVHELTALSTDTGTAGVIVYWDSSNSRITTTSGSNNRIGRLYKVKANGETTAWVRLGY